MRLVEGRLVWSPSDLVEAAQCEYAVLRRLDELLCRGLPRPDDADPLREQVARIGERHEQQVRSRLQAERRRLVELPRPRPGAGAAELVAMHEATIAALREVDGVVHQAGFHDGELLGFADFLVAGHEGWVVSDAKLARQARASALLQLAAYADQVERAGLPLAPTATLLLGDGTEEGFPLAEVRPVFHERRARLRRLLAGHHASPDPVPWGGDDVVACGRCDWCRQAVEATRDLLLVAGMRRSQRAQLQACGARTLDDLAALTTRPPDMLGATFDKLRAQARLQLSRLKRTQPGELGDEPEVAYELVGDGSGLLKLPPPSPGDVFFDFEGDPLHREADPRVWGLEYLWGVTEAPAPGAEAAFRCWWAHDHAQEKQAFQEFMDYVAARRAVHPDMHVYHYAPYETSALKRLAGRYATRQEELDDLLRAAVFVDLYAVVRGSVRVSQSSYSLKKLEPLYMPHDRAGMAVAAGDASIAEYHEAMALRADGNHDESLELLEAIRAYNRYDCESTLGLRDWLLGLVRTHGVSGPPAPVVVEREGRAREEDDDLVRALRARSGPPVRTERTEEEQVCAMVASAVGYHRRESLPFFWDHFNRLATDDLEDWRPDRDVFRVDGAVVVDDWQEPDGKATNPRRRLRLQGRWGPGSTPGGSATVIYRVPCPAGAQVPHGCTYGWLGEGRITVSPDDEEQVELVEALRTGAEPFAAVPAALGPPFPPRDHGLRAAVREVAELVRESGTLPAHPAVEVLRRRPPRLATLPVLPHTGDHVTDLVTTLLDLRASYVPVQGPPGTGKTWTGSRVIRRLVEEHGWRVGVVSASHAVVENMLAAVCRAGLDPSRVGKQSTRDSAATWCRLPGGAGAVARFLDEGERGCVVGGTAWTFTNAHAVERAGLDLLVIDEAGQFSLGNTVAVSVAASRLLLLGDPQQLPQVSQGTHDEPVDVSALRWVMGESATLPRELGYFLDRTYRMHPALCDTVSLLSYDGELAAAEVTGQRRLEGVRPGLRTVLVDDPGAGATWSEAEARAVVEEVATVLGRRWHDPADPRTPRLLTETDVLVVAPYNAQVQLVRRRLHEAGHHHVRVGTVDRFQGQEAPVVIVSMTAASAADVPRGMGFLLNRNRVNVAVSRAQWFAVLVRSRELTSYLPRSPRGLLELGAFIRLSGSSAP